MELPGLCSLPRARLHSPKQGFLAIRVLAETIRQNYLNKGYCCGDEIDLKKKKKKHSSKEEEMIPSIEPGTKQTLNSSINR